MTAKVALDPETAKAIRESDDELYGMITANRLLLRVLLREIVKNGAGGKQIPTSLVEALEKLKLSATDSASGRAYTACLQSFIYEIQIARRELA